MSHRNVKCNCQIKLCLPFHGGDIARSKYSFFDILRQTLGKTRPWMNFIHFLSYCGAVLDQTTT